MTQTLDILRIIAQCPKKMEMWDLLHQSDPHGRDLTYILSTKREKHNDSTSSSPTVCPFAFHLWICRSSSFRFGKCRLPDLTLPAPVLSIFASHFKTYETMRSVSTTIHQIPPENQRTEKTKATICPVISMCFAGLRQSLCD